MTETEWQTLPERIRRQYSTYTQVRVCGYVIAVAGGGREGDPRSRMPSVNNLRATVAREKAIALLQSLTAGATARPQT